MKPKNQKMMSKSKKNKQNIENIQFNKKKARDLTEIFKVDMKNLKTIEEYEKRFEEIAETLLNNVALYIGGEKYRFLEIEFYSNGENHEDIFTHSDEYQKKNMIWYFHRQNGKSYKNGSFKGKKKEQKKNFFESTQNKKKRIGYCIW